MYNVYQKLVQFTIPGDKKYIKKISRIAFAYITGHRPWFSLILISSLEESYVAQSIRNLKKKRKLSEQYSQGLSGMAPGVTE